MKVHSSHDHEPRYPPFAFLLLTFTFPIAYCLFLPFILFYAQTTSAGPDPVTALIPHHRLDWLSLAGILIEVIL